jgi:hypothetical protein
MSQSDGPRPPARRSMAPTGSDRTAVSSETSAASTNGSDGPDVVLIHGPTEDQQGLRVLRAREQGLELGELRPIREGQPLAGEVVKLRPRPGMPRVCDVETQLSREELDRAQAAAGDGVRSPSRPLGHAGPPRVSSEAYRANWDAIYRSANAPGSSELN